ncbi:MAG: flavodoxin family protein [Deltaproteobacteria bacterium]|jgi:multimeric flavodoxin WrbA|nr:flavodoxin family protein [Deltaproteobacteria bacterium]
MKVLAVNGSPRPHGNTAIMLEWALDEIQKEGIVTEHVQIGGEAVRGCKACGGCSRMEEIKCVQDDPVNPIITKMIEADGVILGSPVYFADITPELKCVIDRVGYVSLRHNNFMRRKVGAAAVVARRAGHVHAYDSINHFFGILQMFQIGSRYWNMGVALEKGAIREDREAEETMRILGSNMAWLLKKIHGVKEEED